MSTMTYCSLFQLARHVPLNIPLADSAMPLVLDLKLPNFALGELFPFDFATSSGQLTGDRPHRGQPAMYYDQGKRYYLLYVDSRKRGSDLAAYWKWLLGEAGLVFDTVERQDGTFLDVTKIPQLEHTRTATFIRHNGKRFVNEDSINSRFRPRADDDDDEQEEALSYPPPFLKQEAMDLLFGGVKVKDVKSNIAGIEKWEKSQKLGLKPTSTNKKIVKKKSVKRKATADIEFEEEQPRERTSTSKKAVNKRPTEQEVNGAFDDDEEPPQERTSTNKKAVNKKPAEQEVDHA